MMKHSDPNHKELVLLVKLLHSATEQHTAVHTHQGAASVMAKEREELRRQEKLALEQDQNKSDS